MTADWQLPPGVDRSLADYFRAPEVARSYDQQLADSHLLRIDQQFTDQHFPAPGRLLDLGCGTGRLLAHAAQRGCWCLGVDLSHEMLRVAREKVAAVPHACHFIRANIVELDAIEGGSFDYAACLFSTLGMVIGHEHRLRVLQHVHRLLRPGGVFVLHVHNRWFNFRHPQLRGWLLRSLFTHGGDHRMPAHASVGNITLHLFTRTEAERLLHRASFRIREILPLSLRADARLRLPWLLPRLRAYGYLIAAVR